MSPDPGQPNAPHVEGPQIGANLALASGACHSGEVWEVLPSGLRVAFARADAPMMAIAEEARLTLSGPALARELSFGVRAVGRHDQDAECEYNLRPTGKDDLASLPTFRRRLQFRVRPSVSAPVHFDLLGIGGASLARGAISDLSRSGLSLILDAGFETRLVALVRASVTLRLPESVGPIALACWIRSRSLLGTSIRYGLEFDAGATPGAEQKLEALNRYVMSRQLEMIRIARESAANG